MPKPPSHVSHRLWQHPRFLCRHRCPPRRCSLGRWTRSSNDSTVSTFFRNQRRHKKTAVTVACCPRKRAYEIIVSLVDPSGAFLGRTRPLHIFGVLFTTRQAGHKAAIVSRNWDGILLHPCSVMPASESKEYNIPRRRETRNRSGRRPRRPGSTPCFPSRHGSSNPRNAATHSSCRTLW